MPEIMANQLQGPIIPFCFMCVLSPGGPRRPLVPACAQPGHRLCLFFSFAAKTIASANKTRPFRNASTASRVRTSSSSACCRVWAWVRRCVRAGASSSACCSAKRGSACNPIQGALSRAPSPNWQNELLEFHSLAEGAREGSCPPSLPLIRPQPPIAVLVASPVLLGRTKRKVFFSLLPPSLPFLPIFLFSGFFELTWVCTVTVATSTAATRVQWM